MKIVINRCFGGFSLSHEAIVRYLDLTGVEYLVEKTKGEFGSSYDYILNPQEPRVKTLTDEEWHQASVEERCEHNKKWAMQNFYDREIKRDCPLLVQVVEEMGDAANGMCAKLSVVEIPDGVDWEIDEYDGSETIHEKHRSWG